MFKRKPREITQEFRDEIKELNVSGALSDLIPDATKRRVFMERFFYEAKYSSLVDKVKLTAPRIKTMYEDVLLHLQNQLYLYECLHIWKTKGDIEQNMRMDWMPISNKLALILHNMQIHFIYQLEHFSEQQFSSQRNLGKRLLNELKRLMAMFDMRFNDHQITRNRKEAQSISDHLEQGFLVCCIKQKGVNRYQFIKRPKRGSAEFKVVIESNGRIQVRDVGMMEFDNIVNCVASFMDFMNTKDIPVEIIKKWAANYQLVVQRDQAKDRKELHYDE